MQIHQAEPGWQQYVAMLAVFGVVLGLRARRLMKVRPLKPERLWVVPVLYLAVVVMLFARVPPSPTGWLSSAAALVVGGAAGWQRGKTMAIHVDLATGKLMQRGSIWALLTIAALVAVKMIAQTEGRAWHFDADLLVDALAAFTFGLFAAQRAEMYQRATALLRRAAGPGDA